MILILISTLLVGQVGADELRTLPESSVEKCGRCFNYDNSIKLLYLYADYKKQFDDVRILHEQLSIKGQMLDISYEIESRMEKNFTSCDAERNHLYEKWNETDEELQKSIEQSSFWKKAMPWGIGAGFLTGIAFTLAIH